VIQLSRNKTNNTIKKYLLPVSVCASIISLSLICEATSSGGSVSVIKTVITNITDLIKTDGKIGLQLLSAAAGGVAGAKTVSWQPLVVGVGGAGILEMIFQAIG
jgi:late competence protein required for DNA uptake (superfamily II DNA/RNA helicase)